MKVLYNEGAMKYVLKNLLFRIIIVIIIAYTQSHKCKKHMNYFIATRMAIINKTGKNKCWGECEEMGT